MLGVTGPAAQAVPVVATPVFDPDSVGWVSLRDQTSGGFAESFKELEGDGYIPIDLEIDTDGGDYRVGSVWQENLDRRGWVERRDLSWTDFRTEWDRLKEAAYRLVEQETYVVGGERLYAGIWVQNREKADWASHRRQTNTDFKATFAANRDAGLMPVDFDQFKTSKGWRYSTVWVEPTRATAWRLRRNMTSAVFSKWFKEYKSKYRMVSFESVRTSKGQRYAGIWVENSNRRGWAERRDMTRRAYVNHWQRYKDLGYRLVGFDRYETADGTRYAGIWRQNSERPVWTLRKKVDALVEDEMKTGVPGTAVAVFVDGVPTYLRGFGHADLDDKVWMDSDHVGSIASVSKAVGGVLTMRLEEQNLLELDDDTRDHVPSMPSHHTHTIGDLLANRGCVRHYVSGQDGFANQPYATALAASQEFWDDPLICDPDDEQDNYSTHGYTLLGAALEAAGGDDIKDLVRTELTQPFGLGTLGPQDFGAPHRMTIYKADDEEMSAPNNDWKVLGGGIDSSVADLGWFGAKLVGGQILTTASLTTMWTPPDASSDYAYGWSTGTESGSPVVAKNGSWAGNLAYLRMYPDEEIVVAVMMNSRAGTQSTDDLGRDIGALVLDEVG
jgi:CubicO group peptidase (beta-lactamase class C family)